MNLISNGKLTPTPEQQRILDDTGRKVVVNAAAGSGKTMVLVERYLRHVIRDGLSPDQILTITFTKKAAAEMKRRIVDGLETAGLPELAQVAETGPIQTIHSFCERLLRENAIEAGLDPKFVILEERHAARLIDRCVKEAMVSPDSQYAENLIHSLAGKIKSGDSQETLLGEAIQRTMQSARAGGLSRIDLLERYEDPQQVLDAWRKILLDEAPNLKVDPAKDESFGKSLVSAYRAAKKPTPKYATLATTPAQDLMAAEQTCGLVALACEAWRLLEKEIERRQELDFSALEAAAVRLIQSRPAVRERIRSAYSVVMIDEAQDVNLVQHQLLDSLEIGGKLIVGDVRQSIYGWRHADPQLFKNQLGLDSLGLTENHRSKPGIVNFVNTLFALLWEDDPPAKTPAPGAFENVEVWLQQDQDTEAVARQIARMIEEEGVRPGDIAVLVRARKYAGIILQSLEKAGVKARIAGGTEQFFARLEIRDLANALRALVDRGDDFSLLAALRGPLASLSLDSIAQLALSPPFSEALEGFVPSLESDLEPLQKFRSWFLPLSAYADRLPAWELIAEVFARSGFLEALAQSRQGHQKLANARKLLTMAIAQPEIGGAEFAEQIWEIQQLRHREGDAPIAEDQEDLVSIMTVHKAKGLEFPVVVAPNTHGPLGGLPTTVEIDTRIPMIVALFDSLRTPYFAFLAERRSQRDRDEDLRVLYVALTRAQGRLCVVAHPNPRKESLAKIVAKNIDLKGSDKLGLKVLDLTPASRE